MKKQAINNSSNTNHNVENEITKTTSRYQYTEADLGEDILTISSYSAYPVAGQLVNNMYCKSYTFHS